MITDSKLLRLIISIATSPENNGIQLGKLELLTSLVKQEERAFFQRKLKTILEKEYQLGTLGADIETLKSYDNNLTKLLKEKNAKLRHNGWLWVTINCLESISVDVFVKKIQKISTYTSIDECMWVFEQRGTTIQNNLGKGKHCHLLIKRKLSYKPSALIYKLQRGLASFVGNVKNNSLLNCQIIGDDFAQDKINYITGLNKKDSKHDKQLGDIEWRKAYDLQDKYSTDNFKI